ncbi:MAG TPA: FlgD immunoglobulin-like domain containing protein [Bacteroidota bacterium]|nr:FlgD immunoglobulin-like domain containing protein [Bacteroidota bacterium]
MANTGGDLWEAEVPAQSCIHTISYKVKATDNQGLVGSGANYAFSVVCFSTPYYYPDTGSGSCSSADISTSGSAIPIADFFLPPSHPTNAVTTDDGTAGPFDMGGNFTLFGDDGWRYAWVSVNGGMAASKNATDTIDVNANGLFAAWGFPYGNTNGLRQPGRDTSAVVMARMPINYTAPMSLDLLLADTVGNQYGNIRYEAGPGGDTCLFVVEWDSVAAFATGTTGDPDEEKFRVVFNQCDGTIEYQYDNVGVLGDDTTSICGMQGQTLLEYYYLNQFGTPVETHPRNNWCVKLYPGTTIVTIDGWNMVSVGVSPVGGDYSKGFSYPTALGNVFRYTGSYVPTDPLSNGLGLWAKFSGVQPVGARGTLLNSLTQSVIANWNMIGTIGHPVAIASIIQTNCVVAASSYFGYSSAGYYAANLVGPNNPSPGNLLPGYGYWAKATGVSGSPSITMNAGAAVPKQSMPTDLSTLSRITIIDAAGHQQSLYIGDESFVREPLNDYEMPPSLKDLTGFDARYTSGRMLETYPSQLDEKGTYEYPIRIEAAVYPVTIQWNTVKGAGRSLVLTSPDAKLGNTVMNGSGAVRLTDANIKTVVVTLKDVQVPTRWALGQNYPNPFNPTTRFAVDVPKTAEVSVAIYDILGRKINTLMSGQQAAGSYGIEWDGRDARGMSVPTGIYFVRMTASDFNATQKIMLMK